jgi:hypothetical protein
MNLSNLSNRIEIAFWIGLVALLRDRRVTRLTVLGLVGTFMLLMLTLTAFSWAFASQPNRLMPHQVATIQGSAHLKRPTNGQKNLLLVAVDDLSGNEPSLQGVWMLIIAPSGRKVTFMPVYPSGAELAGDLVRTFSQPANNIPSEAFLSTLEAQGHWWDNYLVVDQAALAALVDLSGGIDVGDGRMNGQQVAGLLSIAGQDDQTALDFQARLAQGICRRLNLSLPKAGFEAITEILTGEGAPEQTCSDLSQAALQASWSGMLAAGGLECEFPTLIGR